MLVVTVELWPYGDKSRRKEIAVGTIANAGTGTGEIGNYDTRLWLEGASVLDPPWKTGGVDGYRRGRYSVWELVAQAIRNALEGI